MTLGHRLTMRPQTLSFKGPGRGFTVIELLVSSALAGGMIVAVMGILGLLSQQQKIVIKGEPRHWLKHVISLMEWDLNSGVNIELTVDEVTISGFGGRNPTNGVPNQRPTRVRYRVDDVASHSWLIRTEEYLDEAPVSAGPAELVCEGVSRIELQAIDEVGWIRLRRRLIPQQMRFVLLGMGDETGLRGETSSVKALIDERLFLDK